MSEEASFHTAREEFKNSSANVTFYSAANTATQQFFTAAPAFPSHQEAAPVLVVQEEAPPALERAQSPPKKKKLDLNKNKFDFCNISPSRPIENQSPNPKKKRDYLTKNKGNEMAFSGDFSKQTYSGPLKTASDESVNQSPTPKGSCTSPTAASGIIMPEAKTDQSENFHNLKRPTPVIPRRNFKALPPRYGAVLAKDPKLITKTPSPPRHAGDKPLSPPNPQGDKRCIRKVVRGADPKAPAKLSKDVKLVENAAPTGGFRMALSPSAFDSSNSENQASYHADSEYVKKNPRGFRMCLSSSSAGSSKRVAISEAETTLSNSNRRRGKKPKTSTWSHAGSCASLKRKASRLNEIPALPAPPTRFLEIGSSKPKHSSRRVETSSSKSKQEVVNYIPPRGSIFSGKQTPQCDEEISDNKELENLFQVTEKLEAHVSAHLSTAAPVACPPVPVVFEKFEAICSRASQAAAPMSASVAVPPPQAETMDCSSDMLS